MQNIENLALKAAERRAALFELSDTDCFRLINGAADGLSGLSVDRFGSYLLVSAFDDAVLEKQSKDLALKKEYRDALLRLAKEAPVSVKGILLKSRGKLSGSHDFKAARRSSLLEGDYPPAELSVIQNGIRAYADLVEGQNAGIFLDMREIRAHLAGFYADFFCDNMLNLFSYTGIFSIHALKNGARRALNVDIAKSVLKRARQNYILNGLTADDRDFIYGDSIDWMRRLGKKGEHFSIAVIDPPTFSRSKTGIFSVRGNYAESLKMLEPITEGGYVFSAVNTFSISKDEYLAFHPKSWQLLMYFNESEDFLQPGKPYLKAGLWKL